MLTKVWEWVKKHWRWLLVIPGLVMALLAWKKGGDVARGLLGKDTPAVPPPGTLTKKEAKEERAEVAQEVAVARIKIESGRVDGHADFDEWMRRGGAEAKPPTRGTK
jgi:hypothetical protein